MVGLIFPCFDFSVPKSPMPNPIPGKVPHPPNPFKGRKRALSSTPEPPPADRGQLVP